MSDGSPRSATAAVPVKIITGHYGSGKTEFAVSLAAEMARQGQKVAVSDLDIVNPYFRSRERAAELEQLGVHVISSSLGHKQAVDLPAISAEVRQPLADPACHVVFDLGGDKTGAKVLVGFVADIKRRGYEMLLVVNSYRPETSTVDGVLKHLHEIENTCGLEFTGLISNTHALRDTTSEDVLAGYELTKQASEASGLPIAYISALPEALRGLPEGLDGERLPIGLFMREVWM